MNEIDYLYEVVSKKVDKSKSWYFAKENIVFLTGEQFKNFKYVVEAYDNTKDRSDSILILSETKIHDKAIRIIRDHYGRLKYRPMVFKHLFENKNDGLDYNVNINLKSVNDNYSVFNVNI